MAVNPQSCQIKVFLNRKVFVTKTRSVRMTSKRYSLQESALSIKFFQRRNGVLDTFIGEFKKRNELLG